MRALGVPKAVEEENEETNDYVRCRPFVVSRRLLQTVVDRYVQSMLTEAWEQDGDATLLAYAMLPNSNQGNDKNEDEPMIGVTQPGIKSGTEIVGQENPMEARIAHHLKLSEPERLRLHLRAKPKIPLCRNTILLI